MKKLILSLFLALSLIGGGQAFAYDEGGKVNVKEASGGSSADPIRVYTLVRYAEVAANDPALSAGEVVAWDTVSDDGVTVGKIGDAGSTDAVAGVVVSTTIPTADSTGTAAESIGRRNWGYIQTYGICNSAMVKGSIAAGQALVADDVNAGYAAGIPNGTASRAGSIFGFAYDASSAAASGAEIFIKNR